ncbi:L-fuculokinase [Pseudoflavonifractor sp. MSJ-37]|uniref:FGGY-family carbohydrate kinase n=1 Tax=Pseudoflavonifractor sp. MSJ-37 TaxID=2841531 RepID=UPI001C10FAF4|nr:FGGY-family carbohydrate kinase [Pseudoflavonifractor sp. MSJ-37]MBU5434093.1 hypothetical protein [Pseudoflavonifractor sp. MSJ-37]
MGYFAGLDVGTSGVKAMAFDAAGKTISYAYQSYPLLTPRDGWCELDAEQIWSACCAVLQTLAAETDGQLLTVAVSSPAQAVVPLAADGTALYHFITTVDSRTLPQLRWWQEHGDEETFQCRTGLPFSSIYAVNKIMWLQEHEPELCARVWKYLCIGDFITWKLTGRTMIDRSLAGRGMMMNVHDFDWDPLVLDYAGIRRERLPEIVPSGTAAGTVRPALARELGLPAELNVVVGAHDQTCGTIGCGISRVGQVMNATGTVEVLDALAPEVPSREKLLRYHYPCSPYIAADGHLVMSINQSGGLLLKWYKEAFCQWECACAAREGVDPYTYIIDHSADTISDIYVLPHLNGAETPIQDAAAAGAFLHLRSCHTKADITRGLLDSLAYELRANVEALRDAGCAVDEIRAIGGGARTPKFLQIKADVCQVPVYAMQVSEAAALGAAIVGAVGGGYFGSYAEAIAAMVQVGRLYTPDSRNKDEYDAHFREYTQFYPALRDIHHQIAGRLDRRH